MSIIIGLTGSYGRINKEIIELAREQNWQVRTASKLDFSQSLETVFKSDIDIFIDFSDSSTWPYICSLAKRYQVPLISGTTGIDTLEQDLGSLSRNVAVMHSKNFSYGIFLLKNILSYLDILSNDITIEESHHKFKRDAPSGTAIDLSHLLGIDPSDVKVTRQGDIVGEHSVSFKFDEQEVRIEHRAFSRKMFAIGAFKVIPWLLKKEKGLYTLEQYLKEVKSCPLDIQ